MTRASQNIWIVTVAFAFLVAATQWGSFGQEIIDWDESTFILLADRLADGHLPYIDLFDNKPPLIFVMLAGVLKVFGDSLIAIRIFGDLCLLVSALLVFDIARRLTDTPSAIGAGVLTILIHAIYYGQHTSTELPATAMVLGATWCLMFRRDRLWGIALAALLISLATLTRSNLGLIAAVFGIYLAVAGVETSAGRRRIAPLVVYTIAGLAPPVAIMALYVAQGGFDILWASVVRVPVSYATGQLGPSETFRLQAIYWIYLMKIMPSWVGGYSVFAGAGTLIFLAGLFRERDRTERIILGLMIMSIALSVLQSGAAYPHYLLQLFPFGALVAAFALHMLARWPFLRGIGLALISVMTLILLERLGPEAARNLFVPKAITEAHLLRQAADAVSDRLEPEDEVWAVKNHLILWYLGKPPVSPIAAHPNNIVRDEILAPLQEAGFAPADPLALIYSASPALVVLDGTSETPDYLPDPIFFESYLKTNYALFFRNDMATVYRRLGHQGWDGVALP